MVHPGADHKPSASPMANPASGYFPAGMVPFAVPTARTPSQLEMTPFQVEMTPLQVEMTPLQAEMTPLLVEMTPFQVEIGCWWQATAPGWCSLDRMVSYTGMGRYPMWDRYRHGMAHTILMQRFAPEFYGSSLR